MNRRDGFRHERNVRDSNPRNPARQAGALAAMLTLQGGEVGWILPPRPSQFAMKSSRLGPPLVTPAKVGPLNPECTLRRWTDSPSVVRSSPTQSVDRVLWPRAVSIR